LLRVDLSLFGLRRFWIALFDPPPGDVEPIHQLVDTLDRVVLGLIGQVGVTDGGEDRVMAEVFLDFDEVDAGLNQVGCIAVAQAVRADVFFRPQAVTT
jgi:hypothetical protein